MPDAVGVYPGSFDPPTVAHVAVADAARRQGRLQRIDLVLSRRPLGKAVRSGPSVEERAELLAELAADRPWLGVRITEHRLLVDIADGYDAVIMGADKWAQVLDPAWYGDEAAARDAALARLPRVLVARRSGAPDPRLAAGAGVDVQVLEIDDALADVSSTLARAGALHLMAEEARRWSERTGHWRSGA